MVEKDLSAIPMWQLLALFAVNNSGSGGVLHIVLEDQNIEDEHIKFCFEAAEEQGELVAQEIACRMFGYLLGQRAACLLIWDSLTMLHVPSAHDYSWE